MEFKKRKISRKMKITIPLFASILIILFLTIGIARAISSIDFSLFLQAAGSDLEQDASGHTNFLLLGNGGLNHDGGDLTDTMIVASLNSNGKLITMISIPRDLYVDDDQVGSSRVNEVFLNAKNKFGSETQGLKYLKSKVEVLMGVPIHYWVKIDFKGFKELIDAIDGIDVDVPEAIYDPFYPKDGTYLYEPLSIKKGQQHFDGETALKYARSRKTTSDFDRAERQQQILYAIKEKALQSEILFSSTKINEILETLKSNISTNVKVKEILTLGALAKDYSPDQITRRLIHDDPNQCGGFLYTPERQYYNGMFVLIPAGGFKMLHLYSDLNFNFPQISQKDDKIQILNGTPKAGVASETKQILQPFCSDIPRHGNARNKEVKETTYYYRQFFDEDGDEIPSRPASLDFLQQIIPGKETTEIPQEYLDLGYTQSANLIIELGADYINSENYLEDDFYYLQTMTPAATSEETETTNEN